MSRNNTIPARYQYAFSNSDPQAADQLAALEYCLDPVTTGVLERTGLQPGARCLEIGAGGGSIARWMAERVAPDGAVVALDLDTSRFVPSPGVELRQHDIRRGLPNDGPYDLIHARLVLLHLHEREYLLRGLVDLLAPGGWLVLGEFSDDPLQVVTCANPQDAELFHRVIRTLSSLLREHGADLTWARRLHVSMRDAGLADVHTVEYAESWTGGGPGAALHLSNSRQMRAGLLAAGITDAELARFQRLAQDPMFCARSWHFVCTRGRKPVPVRRTRPVNTPSPM